MYVINDKGFILFYFLFVKASMYVFCSVSFSLDQQEKSFTNIFSDVGVGVYSEKFVCPSVNQVIIYEFFTCAKFIEKKLYEVKVC